MKKIYFALSIFMIIAICGCKKDNNNSNSVITADPILGLWKIETEQYLVINNNDTIQNKITTDGRYFQLKQDSVMIVYWTYPSSFDKSIWFKKKTDSLYLFFDGPTSQYFDKFKYIQNKDSEMILESAEKAKKGFEKYVYKLRKQ